MVRSKNKGLPQTDEFGITVVNSYLILSVPTSNEPPATSSYSSKNPRKTGNAACTARARWLRVFFSARVNSAIVRPSPAR